MNNQVSRVWIFVAVVSASSTVLTAPASADEPTDQFGIHLDQQEYRGAEAVAALGSRLEAVANHYHHTAQQLTDLLVNDPTARINSRGALYYADDAPITVDPYEGNGNPAVSAIADTDTFNLESRPGSANVLYLNFVGGTIDNPNWYATPIVAEAFSVDSDPTTFSPQDLAAVKEVFLRVAEKYAPFDIDVTTSADVLAASARHETVMITPTSSWLGGAGGICYVGVFGMPEYDPCWTFSTSVGNNPQYIADDATHELGHSLGLDHHGEFDTSGDITSSYALGAGSGATSWGPIMGAPYNSNMVGWFDGPTSYNTAAQGTQDDIALIAQTTGIALAIDEAPGTTASTVQFNQVLAGGVATVNTAGLITGGTTPDVDDYLMLVNGPALDLTVSPAAIGANLAFHVRVLQPDGTVLFDQSAVGPVPVAVSLSSLASGNYYLEISGDGSTCDPTVSTGASQCILSAIAPIYSSAGRYQITGTYDAQAGSGVPDTTAPTIAITEPTGDSPLSGTVTVAANATDNEGVASVTFYVGSTALNMLTTPPYSISWDTTSVADGNYTLTAKAYDAAGNETTSAPVSVTVMNSVASQPGIGSGSGGNPEIADGELTAGCSATGDNGTSAWLIFAISLCASQLIRRRRRHVRCG